MAYGAVHTGFRRATHAGSDCTGAMLGLNNADFRDTSLSQANGSVQKQIDQMRTDADGKLPR